MVKTAYETAQQKNGDHHGWYLQQLKLPDSEIERGIRSFRKQIAKHQQWINNPLSKNPDFYSLNQDRQTHLNRAQMAPRYRTTKKSDNNT